MKLWEISLPPSIINIIYNPTDQQDKLIDEIKTLALKGHEIYSTVGEKLTMVPSDIEGLMNLKQILSREHVAFKQKIEEVQLKLTSPTLESKEIDFSNVNKGKYNNLFGF